MKKIGIVTPGGDAPGMNTAIGTVLRLCRNETGELIGINDGYSGLIKKDYFDFSKTRSDTIMGVSGTILHSARMPSFKQEKVVKEAAENLLKEKIEGLIVIGGDGSFKGAMSLNKHSGVPVVGIPASIDNDIYGTDETIGFDTACNTALEAINKIKDTAISFERIFVVEVMGKKRGFLALEVGIVSGADAILIPEVESPISEIVEGLKREKLKGDNSYGGRCRGEGKNPFFDRRKNQVLYQKIVSRLYTKRRSADKKKQDAGGRVRESRLRINKDFPHETGNGWAPW
jgi:6-phosphofructokinase 1